MDETMNETARTPPFAPFEWLLSGRYLRARRKEGFISVIAGFSFLGIMLGVATLIIVMAVMNGFRKELLDKILGLNGHLLVQPLESPLTDWKDVAERISQVDVTAIEVFTTNPDRIDAFRKAVTEAAGRPVFLVDWRQRNSTFFNALQVERNVMFLILTMIVLVAALNIVSGLIMLVKDKGQDIAILRTMGASQGSIMRIFLITGAAIGVVGTLTGFFVGMLICLNIESIRQFLSWLTNTELFSPELYFLSRLPAEIDFG